MGTFQTLTLIAAGAASSVALARRASAAPAPAAAPAAPAAPTPTATPAPAATATASAAPARPWRFAVEPRVGVTIPTSKLHAMVIGGVELDYAFHPLVIAADLSLTQPSYGATAMDPRIPGGQTSYSIHQTEMVIGLLAAYRFRLGHSLVPHVGAGPVVHLLETKEKTTAAPGQNTATQTQIGGEIDAGADYHLGPGLLAADLRFVYSKLDTMLAGSTNAGNLSLLLGYRIAF